MAMTISEVARRVGLRPSAIRYYEQLGILEPAGRSSGQRRYDNSVLFRLAAVQRARQAGFTLDEVRRLFFGFRTGTRASVRWRKLAREKLADLENVSRQIEAMQKLLLRLQKCPCESLESCGRGIFERGIDRFPMPSIQVSPRRRGNG